MCRCNLNTPPSVPGDFCSCSRSRLRALFTLAVCGLLNLVVIQGRVEVVCRDGEGRCGFLPEGGLDVTVKAEGRSCGIGVRLGWSGSMCLMMLMISMRW
jgi:hypothetical protein